MSNKILITGASGLIGKRLKSMLISRGYDVNTIGRKGDAKRRAKNVFYWDVDAMEMEEDALDGVSAIIHLAGASIADKRWTKKRKQVITSSRVNSARLMYNTIAKGKYPIQTIVSAAAVGIYGDCGDEIVTEDRKPSTSFLAEVCDQWEQEIKQFTKLDIREVRLRIGIVLSKDGGALPELSKSLALGVAGYFSKIPLYYPWVHIDDVCGIFIHAIENQSLQGAYNTCAPKPLPLKELMAAIVKGSGKKALLVPAPAFALKLAMGEMAEMLLSSQRCSAAKVLKSGYQFKFEEAEKAVEKEFAKQ